MHSTDCYVVLDDEFQAVILLQVLCPLVTCHMRFVHFCLVLYAFTQLNWVEPVHL